MACAIKINGQTVQGPQLNVVLQQAANSPVLRDALILDNYMRLTKDEKEIDTQALDYLRTTFGMATEQDVRNSIERENTRREAQGIGKPSGRLIIEAGKIKEKFRDAWRYVKDQFSNKGVWGLYGKFGRMMNETRIVRDGKIQRWLSDAKRNSDSFNALLSKLDKYLSPEDRLAITNVLQNGGTQADIDRAFKTIPFTKLINNQQQKDVVIAQLKPAIKKMRDHIDQGSRLLRTIPNLLTPLQIQTLVDNEGKYTTIVYEAYRNPDFRELYEYDKNGNMKGGPEYEMIFNAAAPQIRKYVNYKKSLLERLRRSRVAARNTLAANTNPTPFELTQIEKLNKQIGFIDSEIARIDDILTNPDSLHTEVLNILQDMEKNQNLTNLLTAGGKRGAISKTIFKKRQDIPQEIKALFGEIKDPVDTYMTTMAKIAATAMNAEYQNNMADVNEMMMNAYNIALANGSNRFTPPFFSTTPLPNAGLTRRITLPDSFSVLAERLGTDVIYTTEELGDFFQDNTFGKIASDAQGMFAALNSVAKINATVLSVSTQERNFIGNFAKLISEIAFSSERGTIVKQLVKASARRLENEIKGFSKEASEKHLTPVQRRIFDAAIEQGVKNSDVIYRGINRKLKGSNRAIRLLDGLLDNTTGRIDDKLSKTVKHIGGEVIGIPFRAYAAGDDIFKEALFASELEKYSQAYFGVSYSDLVANGTPEQLRRVENRAGDIIRNNNTNYNEAWKLTKTINESGWGVFFSPFAIFRLEQARTLIETLKTTRDEITNQDADPQVRSAIRNIGLRRAGSLAALTAMSTMAIANLMNGLDDDEEEYIRKYWVSDFVESPQMSIDRKGNIDVVDMASVNVYGSIGLFDRALADLMSGDEELRENAIFKMFYKIVEPILASQIGVGALGAALKGKDSYDKDLWDPQAETIDKATAFLKYIGGQAFLPGTIKSVDRLLEKKTELDAKKQNMNRADREGVTPELEDLEWEDMKQAKKDISREELALFPGIRQYSKNPNINLPTKIYDMRERVNSNATSYKSRLDKIQTGENRKITDKDRDEVYKELKDVYNKELDKLREYAEDSEKMGYDVMNIIKLGPIKKGETASENTKPGSGFSKKVLDYISGATDEKPDLVIELYDTFKGIKRDNKGNIVN